MICSRCFYSDEHPLTISFDDEGVCSGCRVHDEKDTIDWAEQWSHLEQIAANYRSKNGKNYDCIVPVSGARDSFFVMHVVKNQLRLNPLAVTYNPHYNTSVGFRNLARLRSVFDTDLLSLTVNPGTVKRITRATLRKLGSVYWHCIAGQTVFPVQLAVRLKIPLIVWGVHQGIDQVGMYSHLQEVEMTRRYRHEHDLMGVEAEDLINDFDEVSASDTEAFVYPDDSSLSSVGVRGIYLNNFLRWDSRSQNERMIELYGLETAETYRTFDFYRDIDSWIYNDVHDYLKVVKHGYGVVTDHATRDLRLGYLSRAEGFRMIRFHQSQDLRNLNRFLEWIGMTRSGFDFVVDSHYNPRFWVRELSGSWTRISDPLLDAGVATSLQTPMRPFVRTPQKKSSDNPDSFVLFGRGVE